MCSIVFVIIPIILSIIYPILGYFTLIFWIILLIGSRYNQFIRIQELEKQHIIDTNLIKRYEQYYQRQQNIN